MEDDKDYYIGVLHDADAGRGAYLLDCMDFYDVFSLRVMTREQLKEYCEMRNLLDGKRSRRV